MQRETHILRGPDARRYNGRRSVRWCFGCRNYQVHNEVILFDTPASPGYGWYEPIAIDECSCCGKDRTEFP